MINITTLTTQGQVTIPIEIRKLLGLKPSDKVAFLKKKDEVVIKPAKNFLDLQGSVKSRIKYSDKKADRLVMKGIGDEYKKG
jgi:antitoxin PrlF